MLAPDASAATREAWSETVTVRLLGRVEPSGTETGMPAASFGDLAGVGKHPGGVLILRHASTPLPPSSVRQVAHFSAPAMENVPRAQSVQAMFPPAAAYFPKGQGAHAAKVSVGRTWYLPAAQVVHAAPEFALPAGQPTNSTRLWP